MLEKQLKQKDNKIDDQDYEIEELRRRIADLERQLRELEGRKAKRDDDTSKKSLGKALNHWLHQGLTRALNKWRDEAAWKRRCEMALRRMALRWLKKRVYKAFTKLRDYAEAVRIKELEFQVGPSTVWVLQCGVVDGI